jgi:hypothetical protein
VSYICFGLSSSNILQFYIKTQTSYAKERDPILTQVSYLYTIICKAFLFLIPDDGPCSGNILSVLKYETAVKNVVIDVLYGALFLGKFV